MTYKIFTVNNESMKNESKPIINYKYANGTVIINNKMGFNLKSVEDRIQSLEQLLSDLGCHLAKSSFDHSSNQQTLVVFRKMLVSKPSLKHKRNNGSSPEDIQSLERLAIIKAMKYWRCQYQMYPHLETGTSSGKMMESIYKSYFTEFDPHQCWITPNHFFKAVVTRKQRNLLGLATITLVLRLALITKNNSSIQTKNLYQYFTQLIQSQLPDAYENPSFDNVLALLFMSIDCMSYNDMIGFDKCFTMAAKMTMLLDIQSSKDNLTLLPSDDPSRDQYFREVFIWQAVYYMDSLFSVVHGLPGHFTKYTNWKEDIKTDAILKYLKMTPFLSIPLNPPRLINSFYSLTPGLDEIDLLSFHIVHKVRSLQGKYSHLASPKLIPVQGIFFEYNKYTELNQISKIIQNILINLYTGGMMKEYLETPEQQSNSSALLKQMTHALDLMIVYHYPHIRFYLQPAIMPPSYIPKVSKLIDQLLAIYTDFFNLSSSCKEVCQTIPPFRFDGIWHCLFVCLNVSLQTPSNRINLLINKFISLITIHHINHKSNYSIIDLDKYLMRYGYSLDQYSSNESSS